MESEAEHQYIILILVCSQLNLQFDGKNNVINVNSIHRPRPRVLVTGLKNG